MNYGIPPWRVDDLTRAELKVFLAHLEVLRRDG